MQKTKPSSQKKAISYFLAILAILNLVCVSFIIYSFTVFWIILATIGVIAFFILPKMK